MKNVDTILIVDFGSQYTQLIARRVRESKVYCEIHPFHKVDPEFIKEIAPKGIILSGSPKSVKDADYPRLPRAVFESGLPILGICYGLQLMAKELGGKVEKSDQQEFGKAFLGVVEGCDLFKGIQLFVDNNSQIWMSHGDRVTELPEGFRIVGKSNGIIAVIADNRRQLYGLQFHPEVAHTVSGRTMLENFIHFVCHCSNSWTMGNFCEQAIKDIHEQVGEEQVISALSGGVDSSVTAKLLYRAIGEQLTCVFVDNGLLRAGEREQVEKTFRKNFGSKLIVIDAAELFLERLKGVADPEKKRKIIGATFIDLFDGEAKKIGGVKFLGQGTLYPDVIESVSVFGGPSSTIKSHHNVGGLPERLPLKLIEPLRFLFKDEVRALGKELGIPDEILNRWPFPGPGLAIRVFDQAVTPELVSLCRQADAIFTDEVKKAGLYNDIWQGLAGIPPGRTVGVMGDERTYQRLCVLRAVTSVDGMTADYFEFPPGFLGRVTNRIINEVRGINRVFYDTSSKPPGTIEWE